MGDPIRPYEDAYQALDQSIAETGRSKKEIAAAIYPGKRIETALSLFSRAMTPENVDVHLNVEMIETIIEQTRADDYIFYLCDKHGFERPARKKAALESEIRHGLQGMQRQMIELMRKVEKLEKENSKSQRKGVNHIAKRNNAFDARTYEAGRAVPAGDERGFVLAFAREGHPGRPENLD